MNPRLIYGVLLGLLAAIPTVASSAKATRIITQADIDKLPSELKLKDAYGMWGKPDPHGPSVVSYASDFYDFVYCLAIDSATDPDYSKLQENDSQIIAVYRKETRFDPNPRLVWTSDLYYPKSQSTPDEIESLPADVNFEYVRGKVPCGKLIKLSDFAGVAFCRASVSGYVYEFYFLTEETDKANAHVTKLVSIYISSDHVRMLRWGKIINPLTGQLLPDYSGDPFVKQVEISGFLYSGPK
jgi:hypothetical protein